MTPYSFRGPAMWFGRRLLYLCMMVVCPHGTASAPSVSQAEAQAIRAAVQRQLDAFEKDDAVAAFAEASSTIRMQFGSAARFLAVVKARYQPVYRHRVALFMEAQRVDGVVTQSVRLTDANDRVWIALYRMEREQDGKWHILGCELFETTNVST
ncbi:MAG: hypothetical protein NVSMB6_04210 [Burkholderiaceae bacterium]